MKVAFKTVSTKEELADVSADVVANDKSATRVQISELFDIDHQVVNEHVLLTLGQTGFKLLATHIFNNFFGTFQGNKSVQSLVMEVLSKT